MLVIGRLERADLGWGIGGGNIYADALGRVEKGGRMGRGVLEKYGLNIHTLEAKV